jgi:hypothetical protein
MSAHHALKDPWFLSFLPNITASMVTAEYGGDWNVAKLKLLKPIDYIRTVEELWSTFNSLPKAYALGSGDVLILARKNKDASFEAFPNGKRIQINAHTPVAVDKAIDTVLMTVIGEQATTVCEGNSVCDIIRIVHKPSYQFKDFVRIEVWLQSADYVEKVSTFIKDRLREQSVTAVDVKETNLE